jgi:hypothetical protein
MERIARAALISIKISPGASLMYAAVHTDGASEAIGTVGRNSLNCSRNETVIAPQSRG